MTGGRNGRMESSHHFAHQMIAQPAPTRPGHPPRLGVWVAVTVAAWHLAFFATGAVTLALATSPAGGVFEGLAEPWHQHVLFATHGRVLAGYAIVALGAWVLAWPLVRLWTGTTAVTRWGVVARTLTVLGVLMIHGWLRLAHSQPYFLGTGTYDTWYFRTLTEWPDDVRARIHFILFQFLPGVVMVAAAGVYVVEAARWFREGGRWARVSLASVGTAAVLAAGWWVAPHFVRSPQAPRDGRMNVLMLSSDAVRGPSVTADDGLPHLEALAADSVVLTNVHTPVAAAIGQAASLYTGQAPHTHRLQTPFPSRSHVMEALAYAPQLPQLLQSHGYTTALCGDESASVYAVARGFGCGEVEAGASSSYPRHLAGVVYPAHFIIPTWLDNRIGRRLLPDLAHLPRRVSADLVTERLTERLVLSAESGTPFFLHGVYATLPGAMPSTPTPATPATPATSATSATSVAAAPAEPASTAPAREFDEQLARLLRSLEEHGLRDNTILLILGRTPAGPDAETPSLVTGELALPSPPSAVPVILHLPGEAVTPGPHSQLARVYDLAPTLLDLLDLPPHPDMEGVSLRACLEDRTTTLPLVAFGESAGFPDSLPDPLTPAPQRAAFRDAVHLDPDSDFHLVLSDPEAAHHQKSRWVRTPQWQLVFTPAAAAPDHVDSWRLHDLNSDPGGTRDVKLQNPAAWQALEFALRQWADHHVESPLTSIFPDGEPVAVTLPGT